jgi:hypothetical protein
MRVRIAIEESVIGDPIAASVPVRLDDLDIRRFVYEDSPILWDLPALVVVFRVEPPVSIPREVTGLEIWTEEELAELDA